MKFSKLATALVLAGSALASTSAFAVASITNVDGSLSPFGGFDWDSGGAAFSNDLNTAVAAGSGNFTITYAGWAASLKCKTGGGCTNLATPGLDGNADGLATGTYEYTTYQTITGQIISVDPTGGVGGGPKINYKITGGSWDIYYDTNSATRADAVLGGNWTGFTDGTNVLTGTWGTSFGSFDTDLGTNSVSLKGAVAVNGTNNTYINPDLNGTTLSSTLQLFGFDATDFNAPTAIEGGLVSPTNGALFQADANQTFTELPEPGGLLLAGLALAGVGATSRRRRV